MMIDRRLALFVALLSSTVIAACGDAEVAPGHAEVVWAHPLDTPFFDTHVVPLSDGLLVMGTTDGEIGDHHRFDDVPIGGTTVFLSRLDLQGEVAGTTLIPIEGRSPVVSAGSDGRAALAWFVLDPDLAHSRPPGCGTDPSDPDGMAIAFVEPDGSCGPSMTFGADAGLPFSAAMLPSGELVVATGLPSTPGAGNLIAVNDQGEVWRQPYLGGGMTVRATDGSFAVGSEDAVARFRSDGTLVGEYRPPGLVTSFTFSGSGELVITFMASYKAWLVGLDDTLAVAWQTLLDDTDVGAIAPSPAGGLLIASSVRGELRQTDARGHHPRPIEVPSHVIRMVTLADASLALLADYSDQVTVAGQTFYGNRNNTGYTGSYVTRISIDH